MWQTDAVETEDGKGTIDLMHIVEVAPLLAQCLDEQDPDRGEIPQALLFAGQAMRILVGLHRKNWTEGKPSANWNDAILRATWSLMIASEPRLEPHIIEQDIRDRVADSGLVLP